MKPHTPLVATAATALFFVLLSVAVASPCWADPFGVKLMRPDSLAGWDHGDPAAGSSTPAGWTIADGRLSGTSKSTPLLSGFTAGDCELRLKWSAPDDGAWKLSMPKVPNGPGLELILSEGPDCGRLASGKNTLFPGVKIEPLKDKNQMHTAVIARRGTKLSLAVDAKQLYETPIPPGQYGLGLAIARGHCTLAGLRIAEPAGRPMIETKTLPNWDGDDKKAWSLEDEELVLKPSKYQFLKSKNEYGNFVLTFKYKLQKRGNSGMAIRVPRGGHPSGDGMEIQLFDRPYKPIDKHSQMGIYGNVMPLARADKSGRWNDVVIKADGWMVSAWVNGELVQQYNTLHHPELKHRHLKGWIGPQDHGDWVRFRDIRILEAPPGTGLDAWNKPQPPRAATVIVDRLMNSETVAKNDGITSAVVTTRINGKAPRHTIADLSGPGAVVRIAHFGNRGRLSFYFDGLMEPGLECSPADLWKCVPPLNEDRSPVLTYLAYKKSLRIVLRDANKADYRIDYVSFPKSLPIETFSGPASSIPRGWLEPPLYRQHVVHWGIHREKDPQLRVVSKRQSIAPGKSAVLAHVDGAGLVRWVKLLAWNDVLKSNDLWLSATIDGEDRPAVSAPVRFWFPGFADSSNGNYRNYLMLQRGGTANMLAMPFADGLTIAAENRGKHAINDIGIELSIENATEKTRPDIVGRARLRGEYLPAGQGSKRLFQQNGSGRWVGLICQVPKDGPVAAKFNLTIDGRPMKTWTNTTLDEFLGKASVGFRGCLSGRQNGLAWRYMLMAPVDFSKSIHLDATADGVGNRLALFYLNN